MPGTAFTGRLTMALGFQPGNGTWLKLTIEFLVPYKPEKRQIWRKWYNKKVFLTKNKTKTCEAHCLVANKRKKEIHKHAAGAAAGVFLHV